MIKGFPVVDVCIGIAKLNVSWRATLIASHFLFSFFLLLFFAKFLTRFCDARVKVQEFIGLWINCKFLACFEINTFSKSGRRRYISLNYFKLSTLRFENVNLFSYQSEEQFYIPNRDTNMKNNNRRGERLK